MFFRRSRETDERWWVIRLEGSDITLNLDTGPEPADFLTTRSCKAESEQEAVDLAIKLVLEELEGLTIKYPTKSATVRVTDAYLASAKLAKKIPNRGFTFTVIKPDS